MNAAIRKIPLAEYLDWSDRSYEMRESGQGKSGYAECSVIADDHELAINLRRETKTRKDFTLILPEAIQAKLWEILDAKFGE